MRITNGQTAGGHPESHLLFCCARTKIDPGIAERIRSLSRMHVDWTRVLQMSVSQGVMPLVYRTLSTTCPEAVPEPTLCQLRDQYHANALRNLLLTRELLRLLDHFEAHDISAVPFRGPVLAQSVYGDVSLRQFADLDILIPGSELSRARELLISQGYTPRFPPTRKEEAAHLQPEYHYGFIRNDDRVLVELHWRLATGWFPYGQALNRLSERLELVSFSGRQVLGFSPEDLLLTSCLHGTKHLWSRLQWICDVAELIRAHPETEWNRIMGRARSRPSERMILLGLLLASDLLGAHLPEEVLQKVRADRVAASLASEACARVVRVAADRPGGLETLLFHLKMWDRMWERIWFSILWAGHLMEPTRLEKEFLPLPGYLFPLYHVLRPMRLLGKHGRGLWKRLV